MRLPLILLIGALSAGGAPALAASGGADPCAIRTTERVVAIGDVHGAIAPFRAILREAGLIDARDRWIGGAAWLVQTGDVLDRGPDSRRAIDLLRKLERSAARAGGGVIALLGNHEHMRLTGDWRYVSAGEVAAFARDGSNGAEAFRKAFAARGSYGKWLSALPAVAKINDVVFVHGGITPEVAARGCEGINAAMRSELAAFADGSAIETPLGNDETGPLWYRGLARDPEDALESSVGDTLDKLGARALVVGHTVSAGKIVTRFGGRVVLIDTGMLGGEFFAAGAPAALELRGGELSALYLDGRREALPTR